MVMISLALLLQVMSPEGQAIVRRAREQTQPKVQGLLAEELGLINQLKAELAKPAPNPENVRTLVHAWHRKKQEASDLTDAALDSLFDRLSPQDRIFYLKSMFAPAGVPPRPVLSGER